VDAVERLSLADARAATTLAAEHVHRYEFAAPLCAGLRVADVCCGSGYGSALLWERGATAVTGVDVDAATIESARAELGGSSGLEFERADAVEFLSRDLAGQFDAVVMFEGLEHLRELDRAVAALRRLGSAGVRLAVSIPNSRALGELGNPFHHTDFGHEDATATLAGLGDDVEIVFRFAAEGSLIRGPAAGEGELATSQTPPDRAEPAEASHFIGLVNFGTPGPSPTARMVLQASPVHRRYMRELERANARLWERVEELEERLAQIEASLPWRASAPLRALRRRFSRGRDG
jgi:2-polyprenyl-3-methyl-5-hydroxy-6-metoxy-1,4-benzoquinol methylase